MAVCHVCQHDNPAGAEFCEECGASLSPVGASAGAAGGQTASSTREGQTSSPTPSPAVPSPTSTNVPSGLPGGQVGGDPASAAMPMPTTPNPTGVDAVLADPLPSVESAPAQTSSSDPSAQAPGPAETGAASTPPSGTVSQSPRLVALRHGAPTGEEIPLLGERLVVGRFDPETGPVDIDLSSSPESVHVSRQHGELRRDANGGWSVRDLGSTNGVFVKGGDTESFGPRLTAPRTLADGDEVAFGNARFKFRVT